MARSLPQFPRDGGKVYGPFSPFKAGRPIDETKVRNLPDPPQHTTQPENGPGSSVWQGLKIEFVTMNRFELPA